MGGHIVATWRMQLNRLSVTVRRSYVKLLWPLVSRFNADLKLCGRYSQKDLWHKWRGSAQGRSFLGLGRWMTSFGEMCPHKNDQNGASIGIFKPNYQNLKICNISETIHPISPKFDDETHHQRHVMGGPPIPYRKYTIADVHRVKTWHNVIASNSHEIWCADAKCIETGSRISIWWAICFPILEVVINRPWIDISLRNLVQLKILTFWGHVHYQTGTGSWFAMSTAIILKILTMS